MDLENIGGACGGCDHGGLGPCTCLGGQLTCVIVRRRTVVEGEFPRGLVQKVDYMPMSVGLLWESKEFSVAPRGMRV